MPLSKWEERTRGWPVFLLFFALTMFLSGLRTWTGFNVWFLSGFNYWGFQHWQDGIPATFAGGALAGLAIYFIIKFRKRLALMKREQSEGDGEKSK